VLATAIFRRSGHKYRDRTYRYVLADLGHALENLRAAAAALGVPIAFVRAFDEARAAAALNLDEAEEGVLAMLALGDELAVAPPAAAAAGAEALVRWQPPSLSTGGRLGVTDAIHRATSLREAASPAAPQAPAQAALEPSPAGSAIRLPLPRRHGMPVLEAIARRRSVRRFSGSALQQPVLSALLDAMARRHGPLLSPAVRIHVVTHAVDGLPLAAWRYDTAAHVLQPRRQAPDLRGTSRRAALDQDVVGDAAAVFVLSIDRAAFAADAGGAARGYRHAFLEAGLVGERLYLEAAALGLGVCGVGAFYDDEASALAGLDPAREWVVHFAAVGVRA
jgi:SagB-type dehydrogenase family enzyme